MAVWPGTGPAANAHLSPGHLSPAFPTRAVSAPSVQGNPRAPGEGLPHDTAVARLEPHTSSAPNHTTRSTGRPRRTRAPPGPGDRAHRPRAEMPWSPGWLQVTEEDRDR